MDLNLTNSTGKMARWRLRLSEFELDVVYRTVIKHQATDALLRLKTNRDDRMQVEDCNMVLCIHSSPPEEEKASVMYMHENGVIYNRNSMGLPAG